MWSNGIKSLRYSSSKTFISATLTVPYLVLSLIFLNSDKILGLFFFSSFFCHVNFRPRILCKYLIASLKDKFLNMVSNVLNKDEGEVTKTKCYEIAGIRARIEVNDKADASRPIESLLTRLKKYKYSSFTTNPI